MPQAPLRRRVDFSHITLGEEEMDITRLLPPGTDAQVIAILNNKGGVGKTTVINAILYGLSALGFKVAGFEIELSPRLWQINTPGYRNQTPPKPSETTYGILEHANRGVQEGYMYAIHVEQLIGWDAATRTSSKSRIRDLNQQYRDRLIQDRHWTHAKPFRLMPGHRDLWDLNDVLHAMSTKKSGEGSLQFAKALEVGGILSEYDFVIVDTPPSRNVLQTNALQAKTSGKGVQVIIPVDFDPNSEDDYGLTIAALEDAEAQCRSLQRPIPELLGVVYNKFDPDITDVDVALYERFTGTPYDPKTSHQLTQPSGRGIIQAPQLGLLPMATGELKRSMMQSMSPVLITPNSPLGVRMWDMITRIVKTAGVENYIQQ